MKGKKVTPQEVVKLYNQLVDENKQLKKENKKLKQELFETRVEQLDERLAEYATSTEERIEAWQREFGMTEREAKRKAGWADWMLYK